MSRIVRGVIRLMACLGFLLVAVIVIPPLWYARFLAGPWTEPRGSMLIVLGGDSLAGGSMGGSSLWRCVFAMDIWRQGGFRQLLISGDPVTTASMRDYLVWRGIPAEAVFIEDHSFSTRDNAINTAQFVRGKAGPFVLLTSDFHMWRAGRAFAKAGLTVSTRPSPDAFKRANDWRDRW